VSDKNDLTKLIHLDEVILFGTLFGRKKYLPALNLKRALQLILTFMKELPNFFK
jgi:hypothetical protein